MASEGFSHSNDTSSLKLDSVGRSDVETVIQLASADEHRANFSLTTIDSANGKGKEIFLPGVHSDIGGGYADMTGGDFNPSNPAETLTLNRSFSKSVLEQDRELLISWGWYQEQEIWIESPTVPASMRGSYGQSGPPQKYKLKARRVKIGNGYDRIPLHIMVEFARRAEITINSKFDRKERVSSNLTAAFNDLKAYADRGGSSVEDWLENNKYSWLPDLRNKYFHFSAHYRLSAGFFAPHKPNWINGKRVRKTHHG